MKKKIKIFTLLLITLCAFSSQSVNAKESYYTNSYGVQLTQEEYEFLTKMYWDGYQEIMTQEEYKEFNQSGILYGEFESKEITDNDAIFTRGTIHTTGSKRLKIAKSCTTNCKISVVLTWLNNPTIRSYDVMGAYLNGVSLVDSPITRVVSSNTTRYSDVVKKAYNGFGTSILLPGGSNVILNQDYTVSKGGTVYASYQHATENTNLATSQSYNFSLTGYGRVFAFYNSARNIYDAMNGVDISV